MSRTMTQTVRLSRRFVCTKSRDVVCFSGGVVFTSFWIVLFYTCSIYNSSDDGLLDVVTTLPPPAVTQKSDLPAIVNVPSVNSPLIGIVRNNSATPSLPNHASSLPTIYIITPTHSRLTQKVDLTRLCQTLSLVKNIVWILVEDSNDYSQLVVDILNRCPVKSIHLTAITTSYVARSKGGGGHRGVEQRNAGLTWIRRNLADELNGVVYFGDDDNAYDIQLFEEMRYTKMASVWPVAFVGNLKFETPKCSNGKVTGWHVSFRPDRKFPMDMAAFAVSLSLIMTKPNSYIDPKSKPGMLENNFLTSLGISVDDLEPRANNCKSIYVWHVKTAKPTFPSERKMRDNIIDIIV